MPPLSPRIIAIATLMAAGATLAQDIQQEPLSSPKDQASKQQPTPGQDAGRPDDPQRIHDAIAKSIDFLLTHQEDMDHPGDAPEAVKAEWPYEGVYRVGGQIPMGYRIGGTCLAATCLLRASGYKDDEARREAVARAVRFVCDQTKHPTMSADKWNGGYDVRGWGYTCTLAFFLELKSDDAIPSEPPDLFDRVDAAIKWALDGLAKTEIPQVGGWNYASRAKGEPCPSSPFMTGPTLQALFKAKSMGYAFDEGMIERGLQSLERCRGSTGAFAYSAEKEQNPDAPEPVPGAIGRMLVGEVTLYLAGRSDQARLRAALDAFLAHWDAINARRARPGTHEGPYAIAPYYFYYAHYYAAQAIELLPARVRSRSADGRRVIADSERKDYRRRLAELVFSVQLPDGSWNDRVFPRTASYGTAMSAMALVMPQTPSPTRFVTQANPTDPPKAE